MKLSSVIVAAGIVLLIGVGGCKQQAKQEAPAGLPQGHPPVGGAPASGGGMSQAGGALSGKVLETMNSGGYTYVSLDNNGKKIWVALPESKVKVGQNVTCQPGMEMKNFTSKTLNRSFDSIIFSGGLM